MPNQPQTTQLQQTLESGRFAITSELNPPKGTDLTRLNARADLLAPYVDAVNVTDSHASRMSMAPVPAARLIMDRGLEPVLQLTTRDRNRIALQSDLLGAHALGLRNVVVMGGDPPSNGDHPEAKPVFDLFASQLLEAASGMARGVDHAGNALEGTADFFLGAVVNPGAADLEEEVRRMEEKRAAGARFFQSQAVYEVEGFARFMKLARDISAPVLAGIIPIKSRTMAEYMNARVPGVCIPESLIAQVEDAPDKRDASIEIARRIARELRELCAGLHIMAIGWEDTVEAISSAARGQADAA